MDKLYNDARVIAEHKQRLKKQFENEDLVREMKDVSFRPTLVAKQSRVFKRDSQLKQLDYFTLYNQ